MADIRINSLPSTATSFNTDDYIAIDGASGGTRKMLAANPPFSDVTLGSSGPSVKSTLSARAPRQGLVFDGTSVATVGTISAFGTSDFSVSAIIVPKSSVGAQQTVFMSAAGGFYLAIKTDGTIGIAISGAGFTVSSTGSVAFDKASLITYTRSGTTGTFYINGVSAGTATDTNNYSQPINQLNFSGSVQLFGLISGIAIYNRALSASEVVALYEAGAPAGADYNNAGSTDIKPSTGTYAYWFGTGSISAATASSFTIAAGASSLVVRNVVGTFSGVSGRRYRATIVASGLTYNATFGSQTLTTNITAGNVTNGTNVIEFTATNTATGYFVFSDIVSTAGGSISISSIQALGLLLAPDAAQAGGGLTWYDTSGNNAFITLPASGVRWNVPSSGYWGGNLTVSGTGTSTFSGDIKIQKANAQLEIRSASDAAGQFQYLTFGSPNYNRAQFRSNNQGVADGAISLYTFDAGIPVVAQYWTKSGNSLLGTTIDTGEKLQVNGTGYFAGALLQLGNGSNDALYRVSASNGKSSDFGDDTTGGFVRANNSQSLRFITGGNIVLTLDSSANATFAGKTYTAAGAAATPAISFSGDTDSGFYNAGGNQVALACGGGQIWNTTVNGLSIAAGKDIYLGNAYVAGAPTATGYVTIKDSAGNTYKVLVGT